MDVDDPATCVAGSSSAMILTVQAMCIFLLSLGVNFNNLQHLIVKKLM